MVSVTVMLEEMALHPELSSISPFGDGLSRSLMSIKSPISPYTPLVRLRPLYLFSTRSMGNSLSMLLLILSKCQGSLDILCFLNLASSFLGLKAERSGSLLLQNLKICKPGDC